MFPHGMWIHSSEPEGWLHLQPLLGTIYPPTWPSSWTFSPWATSACPHHARGLSLCTSLCPSSPADPPCLLLVPLQLSCAEISAVAWSQGGWAPLLWGYSEYCNIITALFSVTTVVKQGIGKNVKQKIIGLINQDKRSRPKRRIALRGTENFWWHFNFCLDQAARLSSKFVFKYLFLFSFGATLSVQICFPMVEL